MLNVRESASAAEPVPATGRIIAKYTYDYNGNRILKELFDAQGKSKSVYYPDENLVREVDEKTKEVNDIVYYYDDSGLVAKKENNKFSYYHSDHLGSTSVVTDEQGKVIENNHYLPFGEILEESDERYLYTNQELDPESQLYYYGARYYSPYLAKFTQPDTIIQDVYNPQNLNRYSYVLNNPYKYNDPSGHNPLLLISIAGGAALGAIFDAGKQILFDDRSFNSLDWNEVGKGALIGATAGAGGFLGGLTGGAIAGSAGVTGWAGRAIAGAIGGFAAIGTSQVTDNLLEDKPVYDNVDVAAGIGTVFGGVGGTIIGAGSKVVSSGVEKVSRNSLVPTLGKSDIVITSKGSVKVSQHALGRAFTNKIGITDIKRTIENHKGFPYTYENKQFTGFYDPQTKIFVPKSEKDIITTLGYRRIDYIKNLRDLSKKGG